MRTESPKDSWRVPLTVAAEMFRGAINLVYLRNGILSAEWLAAEAANWLDPGAFYSVAEG
jgi:hypothetical protein